MTLPQVLPRKLGKPTVHPNSTRRSILSQSRHSTRLAWSSTRPWPSSEMLVPGRGCQLRTFLLVDLMEARRCCLLYTSPSPRDGLLS
eukprot:4449661-Pleurochrysis_carterae.AAC.1